MRTHRSIIKFKEGIRTRCDVGKHALHITDDKAETDKTAKVLLNPNSQHFFENELSHNLKREEKSRFLKEKIIEENKKLQVQIDFDNWEGSQFFSTEIIGKTATVKLNLTHRFHNKLYENLAKELDTTNVEIVDLLLMAWARVEDELSITSIKVDDFTKIREKWGQILTELLEEQEQLLN